MRTTRSPVVIVGSMLISLAFPGSSNQEEIRVTYSIEGKWRGEKKDVDEMVAKIRSESQGMPDHLIEPMIAKIRSGAAITGDWQLNADGTGSFGETGMELFPITWKVIKKSGSKWQIELNMNPNDPSLMRISFLSDDRLVMTWLEEDGTESAYPETYHRLR